ncbi:MAG: NAD(P)H-dependent flavin oxidoreductase [Thermodesulfobacteriota bacterium]
MITTAVTQKLGITHPIIGGTMMSITDAQFTAAISNAGGLGILASAIYKTGEDFAKAVDEVKNLTDRPFAVNINLFPAMTAIDNNIYIDVMVEKKVNVVETSGHSAPEDLCGRFKSAGMTWIHKCVGIRYAQKAEKLGADIITVVGYENGGATGKLDIGTLVLVPSVVDGVKVPVIGGGGVSDGRGLLAVLALGAGAAIMGSRLLVTRECPIHENLKKALMNATELETRLIMRSIGATHRVWDNAAAQKCAKIEAEGGDFNEVISVVAGTKARHMYATGDLDAGVISCGQGIGLVHDIPTVQQLFDRTVAEAEAAMGRINVTA